MKNIIYFFLLCHGMVNAQIDSTSQSKDLNEIVIIANRFEGKKKEQPNQIEQIIGKTIAFQNAPNTADMLINTGKIFVQKSQAGGGSPVLRGFEASRVLFVVDGVRMNNAIYRAGHLQNVLRVDQSLLESAEVVFGPSSLLYGSDALGGVIVFTSKAPKLENKSLNFYSRYSSGISEKTSHIDFNLGGKRFSSLSSITYSDFGDVRQGNWRTSQFPDFGKQNYYVVRENNEDKIIENPNPNIQKTSGYSQIDLLQKIFILGKNGFKNTINFQYSTSSNVPRYDRLTEFSNNLPKYAEWFYGPEMRFLGSYQIDMKETKFFSKGRIITSYQNIEESRISRRLNSKNRQIQIENVQVGALNADFIKYLEKSSLQYGLEYVHNDVQSKANSENIQTLTKKLAATRYPNGGSTVDAYSAYLTNKMELIASKLIVNYGARYNYTSLISNFSDKTFFPFPYSTATQKVGALVANGGIVWFPSQTDKFSFLVSNGFRVPNVDDLGKVFDSSPGTLIVPNPSLTPEYTYNFELNYSKSTKNFSFEAVGFLTNLFNALAVGDFNLNGQTTIDYQGVTSKILAVQNLEKAKIMGFSIYGLYKISPHLSFSSSLNNTKGNVKKTNAPLDHIPPLYGKTALVFSKTKSQIELLCLYNGKKKLKDYSDSGEDNLQYATADGMPAWWIISIRGQHQFNKVLGIQGGIENIFDKNYRYFASGISGVGRNLSFTIRVSI